MKRNNNGFALIESILIILTFVIIGFGGYYVWHTQRTTDKVNSDTVAAGNSQVVSKPDNTSKTLSIKEWGVKAKYTSGVDLIYNIKTDDEGESWAQTSSTQLVNSDPEHCSLDSQLGGIISRLHSGADMFGPAGQDTGVTIEQAIKDGSLSEYSHVGDYYYFYQHPQAACGSDGSESEKLQAKTLDAVQQAAKNLIAIE